VSFPVPPSDNIYKFSAIAGLVVVISTHYIFFLSVREFYDKAFEITAKHAAISVEAGRSHEAMVRLDAEIKAEREGPRRRELQSKRNREDEAGDAIRLRLAEVRAQLDVLGQLRGWAWWATYLSVGAGSIGIGVSVWGFFCWYFRVQVYQDRALRARK
jgi:hypothetical protein